MSTVYDATTTTATVARGFVGQGSPGTSHLPSVVTRLRIVGDPATERFFEDLWEQDDRPRLDDSGSGELLDDVRRFIARFVAFPSQACLDAVTLWAAHAHLVLFGDNTPRLALLSPEPGSGKTRTLEILELLTPAPMFAFSASPAALFRSLAVAQRSLLFDEVDAIFGRHGGGDDGAEDLRALLNAGHRRGASIPRCVGATHEVRDFPVFAAVALAGLGDLPDTLMSRSIIIRMRRRLPSEVVEPFRHRQHADAGHALRERLAEWAEMVKFWVEDAWPEMPSGVTDRPADCWEPLLAVADAAGGHWPETARTACIELVQVAVSREASLGVKLLEDLRSIFGDEDVVSTEVVLERLNALEESPWGTFRGKPLDARGLARRLVQYGIGSAKVRIGTSTVRGYRRTDLWDTWQRYLAPNPMYAEQPEQPEQCRSDQMSSVPDAGTVPELAVHDVPGVPEQGSLVEHGTVPLSRDVPHVPHVPDFQGSEGDWPDDPGPDDSAFEDGEF